MYIAYIFALYRRFMRYQPYVGLRLYFFSFKYDIEYIYLCMRVSLEVRLQTGENPKSWKI